MSFARDANTILLHVDYSISASTQGEYRTQTWSYFLLPLRSTRSTKSPSISGQRAEFIETEIWHETFKKYRGYCWSAPGFCKIHCRYRLPQPHPPLHRLRFTQKIQDWVTPNVSGMSQMSTGTSSTPAATARASPVGSRGI